MLEIPLLGKFLSTVSTRHLGDYSDRLHSVYTVALLVLCAMFVGGKQHFGEPIQCMLPTYLDKGSWASYGQYYCFVEGTYRLELNRSVPGIEARTSLRDSSALTVRYYQWVPYFFIVQALCFVAPSWIFRFLQSFSLIDMQTIVDEATVMRDEFSVEERKKKVEQLNEFLCASLDFRSDSARKASMLGRLLPNHLSWYSSGAYFICKLLTVLNNYCQLRLIAFFLGIESPFWGFSPLELATKVTEGEYSVSAQYFPRVTFCDMDRLTQGSAELTTLQCVMMLNIINEKIFLMLWYWIGILFVVSVLSVLHTFIQLAHSACRESMVRFFIQMESANDDNAFMYTDKKRLRQFVFEVLGLDGLLVLRFVYAHAGAIVARDLVSQLFRSFVVTYMGSSPIAFVHNVGGRGKKDVEDRVAPSAPRVPNPHGNLCMADSNLLLRRAASDEVAAAHGTSEKRHPPPP